MTITYLGGHLLVGPMYVHCDVYLESKWIKKVRILFLMMWRYEKQVGTD